MKFSLDEIKAAMKADNIGDASTRYVLERLRTLDNRGEEVVVGANIQAEVKAMPNYAGVRVYPSSNNNVTFQHKGETCHLHFMTNGNIGLSKESNKNLYLEINKDQILNFILNKF